MLKIAILIAMFIFSAEAVDLNQKKQILLNTIAVAEGTDFSNAIKFGFKSEYDISFAFGKYAPDGTKVSKMKIKDIRILRNVMVRNQRKNNCSYSSTAMGKYGFTMDNFENFIKRFPEINSETVFSAEIQDMFAKKQIEVIGFDAFLKGRITIAHYQRNLAKKWASIPDPDSGKSRYKQPIGITNKRLKRLLFILKHS